MNPLFILILSIFFFTGCTTTLKKAATPAPVSFKNQLAKAQTIEKSNPNQSISLLNNSLANHEENDLSDDALFLLGKLLTKKGDQQRAIKSYQRVLDSKYSSPIDGKVILNLAKIHLSLGKENLALRTLSHIDSNTLLHKKSLEEIETLRLPLLIKDGEHLQYLRSAQNILDTSNSLNKKEAVYNKALSVQKIKISGSENKRVLGDKNLAAFHPTAALGLAEFYFERNQPEQATETLEKYKHIFTTMDLQNKKQELLLRTHAFEAPNKDVVGVLIPLSGKYKSVGQKILNGIEYSLGVWSQNSSRDNNIKLAILDTAGEPEQLKLAFDELMKTDKPIAIVGGLVSRTAKALIEKADSSKIPTIILSQKNGLVEDSKYAFQVANSISSYTDYIAKFGIQKLKVQKIAIMSSNKSFSQKYANAFKESFTKMGGEIVQTVEYNLDDKRAISNAIKKLIHLNSKQGREEEYRIAYRKWRASKKNRRVKDMPRLEELLPPLIEFDALFIADGPKNSGLLASTLAYFDVEKLTLLGTHLWNNESLITRGQRFVENSIFANSFYEPSVLTSSCGKDFMQLYNEPLQSYPYKGVESGILIKKIFEFSSNLTSRNDALRLLSRTSTLTHPCLINGLARKDHNFSAPLIPLTVKNKSIIPLDLSSF